MHTIDEQISLLKAEAEGREIEALRIDGLGGRLTKLKGVWSFENCTYRIKPRMKRMEQIEHLRFTAACHAMQGILAKKFDEENEDLDSTIADSVEYGNALLKKLGYE